MSIEKNRRGEEKRVGIYERIKAETERRGENISKIEKKAGLSNGTIGKWRECSPRVAMLEKVAEALKVPVTELLKEEE